MASKDENRSMLGTPGPHDRDPSHESLNEAQLQPTPTSDEVADDDQPPPSSPSDSEINETRASTPMMPHNEIEKLMPSTVGDGARPHLSYPQLVAMAILDAPERKLAVPAIYEWISKTFSFYRLDEPAAQWKNGVRKALSRDEFTKQGKHRSSFWAIQPGKEISVLYVTTKYMGKQGVPATGTTDEMLRGDHSL